MQINKFIVNLMLAAAPLAASQMVYLKDTGTGFGTEQAVTADSQGNAFVAGTVSGGATGTNLIGPRGGLTDVKVVKLSQTGQVIWTTIIGGSGTDKATSIAVAPNGQLLISIDSSSTDFPLAATNSGRAVVVSLDSSGTALAYATRIAGAGAPLRIFVDAQLNAYVGGNTLNADFVQVGVAVPPIASAPDSYLARLSSSGAVVLARVFDVASSTMIDFAGGPAGYFSVNSTGRICKVDSFGEKEFCTFSGAASRVAMDSSGFGYSAGLVAGQVQVSKWQAAGPLVSLYESTVLPVSTGGGIDSLAVNAAGEAHVAVRTSSANVAQINPIPGTNPQTSDNALANLSSIGFGGVLSTYLGIPIGSQARHMVVNAKGIFFAVNGTHVARVMERAVDMSVTGVSRVKNGNVSSMTVRVFNNGPDFVSNAGFQARIPGTPQGITTTQGHCNISALGIVSCGFGALASGGFVNVTMTTIPPASGNLEASPTAGSSAPDPNTTNNGINFSFLP